MTDKSATIRSHRNDLSPYLFHYTKGKEPLETLKLILEQMRLKADCGYICFTEAPLTSSVSLFKYFHQFQPTDRKPHIKPMYEPYGIGISRDFLFNKGARPIFYGTSEELQLIPNELKWRCLPFDPLGGDYSWLREWRINSNEFNFSTCTDEIIVIARTKEELNYIIGDEILDIDFTYEPEIGKCVKSISVSIIRFFKGIAMNEVNELECNTDNIIAYHVNKQKIGEVIK